jgi:hypothetical protein
LAEAKYYCVAELGINQWFLKCKNSNVKRIASRFAF